MLRIVAPRAVGGALFRGDMLVESAVVDFARRAGWDVEVMP